MLIELNLLLKLFYIFNYILIILENLLMIKIFNENKIVIKKENIL